MITIPSIKFMPLFLLASAGCLSPCLGKKILCLHGGGGTGNGFSGEGGMRDLEQALPDFEFVYADGGYPVDWGSGYLWIPDPPGGKGEPTTDPSVSDASIAALDEILANEGPFDGILGYSQGAAYVPVYLSRVPPNTFEFALSFCGYPTETHIGILDRVEEMSPFDNISSLIWIGEQDFVIPNSLTRETIPFYTSPVVIESSQGGHEVPGPQDSTFDQVVSFIASHGGDSAPVPSPVAPPPTLRPVASPTLRPVASPTPLPTKSEDDKEEEPCEDNAIYRFKAPCSKPSSSYNDLDKEIDGVYSKEDSYFSYDDSDKEIDGFYSKEDSSFSSYDDYGKKIGTEGSDEKAYSSEFLSSDGTNHWSRFSFACLSLFFVPVLVV